MLLPDASLFRLLCPPLLLRPWLLNPRPVPLDMLLPLRSLLLPR